MLLLSTHADLDVLQEKRSRIEQTLVRFLEMLHKVHFVERKTSRRMYVVRGRDWQRFKRQPDQIMCGQKYGYSCSESRNTGMGKRRTKAPQCSKTERNLLYRSRWRRIHRKSQKRMEKTGKTSGTSHAVWKTTQWHHEGEFEAWNCIREEFHNSVWLYGGISWIHKATSGIFSAQKKSWRPHCRQRVYFDQLGTQVHANATSDDNSGCKSRSGQGMEKAQDDPSMAFEKSQQQKKWLFWQHKETKEKSTLPHWRTYVTSKCVVGTQITEVQRQSRVLGDTVKDDSGAHAVFTEQASSASQMTAGNSQMLLQYYQVVTEKQLMQYLLIPR